MEANLVRLTFNSKLRTRIVCFLGVVFLAFNFKLFLFRDLNDSCLYWIPFVFMMIGLFLFIYSFIHPFWLKSKYYWSLYAFLIFVVSGLSLIIYMMRLIYFGILLFRNGV